MKIYSFNELNNADLVVDAIYEGGSAGNTSDDPISKLIPGVGNMGGFRYSGNDNQKKAIVLYTSGSDQDWPDSLDPTKGQFIYYGDNKKPGHLIHDTHKKGNRLLKNIFDSLHSDSEPRKNIPPIYIFLKYPTKNSSRSVQFKGLAVPGYPGMSSTDDLIAIWKTTNGERFQNYRAIFTTLDIPVISRDWIENQGLNTIQKSEKDFFDLWKKTGKITALISKNTTTIRSQIEQTPKTKLEKQIIKTIYKYFCIHPIAFESCAARIYQLQDNKAIIDEITRGSSDGGRDAIGRYVFGIQEDPIYVEFSLEAKCYNPGFNGAKSNSVGVKEVSRLISRIRNRQFGVLVTTSFVAKQAYEEVREDEHPIIFITGKDIAQLLIRKGINSIDLVESWLKNEFPLPKRKH
jgi:Restriction endonuclease AspBHI N-terminal/Restriction endonuclease